MADQTAQLIQELTPWARYHAIELINAARIELGLPAVITSAKRNLEQQKELLRTGRTRTLQSKHLLGQAFDVDMYGYNRDQVPAYVYQALGELGERFGLTWGGRFVSFRDVGHFEL